MAAIALRPVLPEVPIILVMTGIAFLRHFLCARRFAMTVGALELGVRAQKREMRIPSMIKYPQLPAVRRMAGFALVAKAILVNVIGLVTTNARLGRLAEGLRCMALGAAHHAVQPNQRKGRQIVIETQFAAPTGLPVAAIAAASDLAAVRVFAAMASGAVFRQLAGRDVVGMASMAVDFRVCTQQREFVLRGVIVGNGTPLVIVMAVIALRTESMRVRIITSMAAVAVLGNLVLVVAAAMTGEAIKIGVRSKQRVAGFLQVIVFGGFPFLGDVAFAAVRPARTPMLIVGGMTADAGLRGGFVAPTDMTRIASRGRMGARQSKRRLIMIKFSTAPALRGVTLAARLCQLTLVRVVFLVTTEASSRRLAPCDFWFVT